VNEIISFYGTQYSRCLFPSAEEQNRYSFRNVPFSGFSVFRSMCKDHYADDSEWKLIFVRDVLIRYRFSFKVIGYYYNGYVFIWTLVRAVKMRNETRWILCQRACCMMHKLFLLNFWQLIIFGQLFLSPNACNSSSLSTEIIEIYFLYPVYDGNATTKN
jgi:hypothetical protein